MGTVPGRPLERRHRFFTSPAFLFLLPMLLYIFVWRIFPLMYTMFLSTQSWNIMYRRQPTFIGIQNYLELAGDNRFHHALFVSFFFMFVATGLEVVVGTILAVIMDEVLRGRGVLRGIILLPMFLNPVAVGTIWKILYEPSLGPLNYFIQVLGGEKMNWLGSSSTALWAILVADIWQWSPFIFLLVLSALQGIPQTLVEAARIDGASNFMILRKVTLPMIAGTVFVAALLRAMDAFRVFPKIYIMTGGGPGQSTESASILVMKTAFRYFEVGYGASMTIVMLILLMVVYGVYLNQRLVRVRAEQ
jgi:multiple sugar transport system permease protein